jgi:ubiquinone/menaquinone biosynthesis C-methylase UbiE
MSIWDDAYRTIPPWDIGRPQPALVEVAEKGEMRPGRVLDVGCGTGENALFLARSGFTVFGIDMARDAVKAAKAKALQRGVKADFELGNALATGFDSTSFDNVIDSGLFHTFEDRERSVYVGEIARVLRREGKYFMLCFSDKEPTGWGPRRITREEIEKTFSPLFEIKYIRDVFFATRIHDKGGKAYLTSATKLA